MFGRYGVEPPKGVLLWGPPGTGKTRLAAATAANAEAAFFVINGPDLISAFYGHSEQSLKVRLPGKMAESGKDQLPDSPY